MHGEVGKHPGFSKMRKDNRQHYYLPSIANHVCKWVKKCQICVHNKQNDNSQFTPEVISVRERDLGLEDVMQIDLLPEFPPSGGYENIITAAIDVFSNYAFAYPVSIPKAVNKAKVIIDNMTRHAYLPTVK